MSNLTDEQRQMLQDVPRDVLEDIVETFLENIDLSHGDAHPWIPGGMDWPTIRATCGALYPVKP
jgi:hypothetical protein